LIGGLTTIYDGTPKSVTVTTEPASTQENPLTVDVTYDGSPVAPTQAGSYAVVATVRPNNWNYHGSATSTLVIQRAPLTVTANHRTKIYGSANPLLTYTISGFVNNETIAVVTGSPGMTTNAVPGSPVGNYPITPAAGTLAASNYLFATFVNGTLSVTPAALTVTPGANTKVYGTSDSALAYSVSGFVNNDTASILTGALGRVAGENVGNYAITQGTLSAGGNYTLSIGAASFGITPATLTVIPNALTKVYGAADPTLTYVLSGLVNSDTASIMAGALGRAAGENVGNYGIFQGTLSAGGNYTLTVIAANFSITKAPLKITADNKTRAYGTANPQLTATYAGLVNGDSPSVVSGSVILATSANASSAAGDYPITVTGPATTTNYNVTYANGTLTITGSPPTNFAISGLVFLDLNTDGFRQTGETGLGGVTVKLYRGYTLVATTSTSVTGAYAFATLSPNSYTVDVIEPAGLGATSADERNVTVADANVTVPEIGLYFNFSDLRRLHGDGMSQGYWKNNISKAIDGKTSGTQELKVNLIAYTTTIGAMMLSPYDALTMASALSTFNGGDQLKLQLLASEYNFVSGRFINDSQALTHAFIYWGEHVQANASSYSSSYKTFVKNWMDAFNNSHGGPVNGPMP
jgi:hypothetical protein